MAGAKADTVHNLIRYQMYLYEYETNKNQIYVEF